jgi:hypothetical protein
MMTPAAVLGDVQGSVSWLGGLLQVAGESVEIASKWWQADNHHYWPIDFPANSMLTFNATGMADKMDVYLKLTASQTWALWHSFEPLSGLATRTAQTEIQLVDGIAIKMTNSSTDSVSLSMSSSLGATAPAINSFDLLSHQTVDLGKISLVRVTALSLLATYTGPELEAGGQIAAARVRAGWQPGAVTAYEGLTQLVDHSYNGKIKTGAYSWYLPYNLTELEFRHPCARFDATSLQIAGNFDDAAGSLTVTARMVVEFYTPLQLFAHKPSPPMTDAFQNLIHPQ